MQKSDCGIPIKKKMKWK